MNPIYKFDKWVLKLFKRHFEGVARLGFFVIYFWFGLLKVLGLSPANPLVEALFSQTFLTHYFSFGLFLVFFGYFEMFIGILFLFPKLERVAFLALVVHLLTTVLPLFILSPATWQSPFVPTLEGQYIIKNIALLGLAMATTLHLHPMHKEA